LIIISAGYIFPQNINGRFSSSVYSMERFDTTNVSNNYLRAYELLNLNINQDKFSLRTYLDFEGDLTGNVKKYQLFGYITFMLKVVTSSMLPQ